MTDYLPSDDDSDEQKQTKEQKRDELSAKIQELREKCEQCIYTPTTCINLVHPDMMGFLHTQVYNSNFDISDGYISCAISSEDMNVIYDNANLVKRVAPQVKPGNQLMLNYTTAEEKKKCNYAKELLRTISSCFETPVWGTCTQTGDLQCVMPNTCHTPDSVIAVVPENSTEDLRYPILICEVLGKKKSKGTNEEKFDGFNATMQSLVFAPQAYYCEIIESDARMFLLKKVPEKGYLSVEMITYRLYERRDFQALIKDICRALIDALVNLTPIAQYSAKCLHSASYRDFLNVPSTHSDKIEPHCWHLFIPQFLNQDRAEVPGDFLAGIDLEDPSQPDPVPNLTPASIIKIRDAVSNTLPVNESNIDLEAITDMNARLDLSLIRAVRDEEGKPVSYEEVKTAV